VDTFDTTRISTRRHTTGSKSASPAVRTVELYGGWTANRTCKSLRYSNPNMRRFCIKRETLSHRTVNPPACVPPRFQIEWVLRFQQGFT